jgi:DNA mismatch repair protein MutL
MPITLLPEHVANQIAAGEVVEGPSSVIKELVENSIDAGADTIKIEISDQLRKIKVFDNGCGMSADDLDLAFKRHATSKITKIEDIYSLNTNGFRGEALASIASISKVTCITKQDTQEHAYKLYIDENGEQKTLTGAGTGTSIIIEDLFFNTPARAKFLKSNSKEQELIIDTLRSLAIAHLNIAFKLTIDGKTSVSTSGIKSNPGQDLISVISEIFSMDLSKDLCTLNYHTGDLKISGCISQIHRSRSDKRGIFVILNQRVIRCEVVRAAIHAAYKDLLKPKQYPYAVIIIEMPQKDVDVNVHPRKLEVKYKDTNKIYATVRDAIAKALAESFYASNQSYQTNLPDYNLINQVQIPDLTHTFHEAPTENLSSRIEPEELNCSYIDDSKQTNQNTHKFLARLGSIDIRITDEISSQGALSSQGNRTVFEVVAKTDNPSFKSIILKGDFSGEVWLRDKYLSLLQELADEILDQEIKKNHNELINQKPILPNRSRPQTKVAKSTLEKIWERDHYTCVYCQKALLNPHIVKKALKQTPRHLFRSDLGANNKVNTKHILLEHIATHDHHLPVSKFLILNTDERNLHACCSACNLRKSDSLAYKTWTPRPANAWENIDKNKPLEIAGLKFISATEMLD